MYDYFTVSHCNIFKEYNKTIIKRYLNAMNTIREQNFDAVMIETIFEHMPTTGLLQPINFVFEFVYCLRLDN